MRRGLGRGRLLTGLGATLLLASMPLPWYTAGGRIPGLPPQSSGGLAGAGIVVFLAAVGLLAVIALPYAARTGRSSFDRLAVYMLLLGVCLIGLAVRALEAWQADGLEGIVQPDRSFGLWLAAGGAAIATWGLSEVANERPPG